MSHQMLRPFIVKVSVLGYFPLNKFTKNKINKFTINLIVIQSINYSIFQY